MEMKRVVTPFLRRNLRNTQSQMSGCFLSDEIRVENLFFVH